MPARPPPIPRRVFLLTPNLLGADGVSAYSRTVAEALAAWQGADGFRLAVWGLNEPGPDHRLPSLPGADVRFAGGSKRRFLSWCGRAALSPTAGRRDLVVVAHLGLAPAALPLAARGADLVTFLLGIEAWRPLGRLDRLALGRSRVMAAISAHTRRRFDQVNPSLAGVPGAVVPLCRWQPAPADPSPALTVECCWPGTAVPLAAAGPFALIVGRLAATERYKGHDALFDCWPAVRARVPDARLLVVGDGDDRPRLEERVRTAGLGRAVAFAGRLSDAALAACYAACRFFAMPSTGEGFGLVYLEAMAAGKACLGAPGAAAEVIADGETGLIVDPADGLALTAALGRLFNDDGLCQRLGEAGRRREAEEFGVRAFRERVREVLFGG